MIGKRLTNLALTAVCTIALGAVSAASAQTYQQQAYNANSPQVVTNGPQVSPGDGSGRLAQQDVIQSQRYDHLLETNLAFRHFRERKECRPVADPQLRGDCFASFQQYEPFRYAAR
jgi:hypothetical protein